MMPAMQPVVIVPEPGSVLTFDQSYALMNDPAFKGRVQVACLSYAQYITIEPTGMAGHNTRMKWAQGVFQAPAQVATQVAPPTVMNPNVQQAGSAITDDNLSAAVQAVVNSLM